jgi:hypothetical protein
LVKCTLVKAWRFFTGRTAHRVSRVIALLFHDQITRRWRGVRVTPRPLFTPGKTRYPLNRRLGGPVWTGANNLARTEIRFPDRPARSQLLYRLRYPAQLKHHFPLLNHCCSHCFTHTPCEETGNKTYCIT